MIKLNYVVFNVIEHLFIIFIKTFKTETKINYIGKVVCFTYVIQIGLFYLNFLTNHYLFPPVSFTLYCSILSLTLVIELSTFCDRSHLVPVDFVFTNDFPYQYSLFDLVVHTVFSTSPNLLDNDIFLLYLNSYMELTLRHLVKLKTVRVTRSPSNSVR